MLVITNPNAVSFSTGFVWGIIFNAIYFYALFELLREYSTLQFPIFGYVVVILYAAIFSAGWFWLFNVIARACNGVGCRIAVFIGATLAYCSCVHYFFFIGLGVVQGNPFVHFLLPLMIRSQWLYLVPYVGCWVVICIICLLNAGIALLCMRVHCRPAAFMVIACSGALALGWMQRNAHENTPACINQIGCLVVTTSTDNPYERMQEIARALHLYTREYPGKRVIIMPESTYMFPLNQEPTYVRIWYEQCYNDVCIIMGAHRIQCINKKNTLYNSLFVLQSGRIIQTYDKQHQMFLTEYLPHTCNNHFFKNLFLHNKKLFNKGLLNTQIETDFFLCTPYICSELFFNDHFSDDATKLLCIANDSWFLSAYAWDLLYLCAHYKALAAKRDCLYIAHKRAYYLCSNGDRYPLDLITL